MITTDIIFVLYGDRKDLDRCIESVHKNCKDYQIHIIDNNTVNRGFTAACNTGIQAGTAPFVWLLNQDAIVLEGAQEALIERLKSDPKIGIAGSMQLDPEDNDLIRHGGTLQCFPAGAHKGGRVSLGHCRFPEKQVWVNGASMMLKREMVEQIGLMDTHMFLVYSESDYCLWSRYHGWSVWYEPKSRVIHRLGKASKNSAEWQRKDMQAFMDKWNISMLPDGNYTSGRLFEKLNTLP